MSPATPSGSPGRPAGGSSTTAKRVNCVTEKADGRGDPDAIALAIWDALCDDPPYELTDDGVWCPPEYMWTLLDGLPFGGACHHQAELMRLALKTLGVVAGYGIVYGSTSDGDCRSPEWRDDCPHGHLFEWLIMNDAGAYHGFAACCVAGGWWYCLVPQRYGPSDWHMLWEVAGPPNLQRWCETRYDLPSSPGAPAVIELECDVEPTPEPGQ